MQFDVVRRNALLVAISVATVGSAALLYACDHANAGARAPEVANDLKVIADARGVAWMPRDCRNTSTGAVVCDARLSIPEVERMARNLELTPYEGRSNACTDVLGELPFQSWRSSLSWASDTGYEYVIVSVAMEQATGCIETRRSSN